MSNDNLAKIKTSQNGVDYATPQTLKMKQRAYSQAILMKIPHKHSDTLDISLKLGRYKKPVGQLETNTPKSELTLDNDELNALIKYISENYIPINIGSGEYIDVSGNNSDLIKNFKNLI